MYTTISKLRNPLISYAEMSLPLPAARTLWLSPTPEAWQLAHFGMASDSTKGRHLSLRHLLADGRALKDLSPQLDVQLSSSIHLHGNVARIWEYRQQTVISNIANDGDPSAKLWMQWRHQTLYQELESTRKIGGLAVTMLLNEFLMMSLHADIDCVTRFAGKCGEAEAHRAYRVLLPWAQSKNARVAMWHAGQVVKLARDVPPYQLRGPDVFLIYHSVMVLWTYAMLQREAGKPSGHGSPGQDVIAAMPKSADEVVYLDAEGTNTRLESFLAVGSGRPYLGTDATTSCDMRDPRGVMAVGVRVLEGNYPNEVREHLPQLIRSMCELMGELGSLT